MSKSSPSKKGVNPHQALFSDPGNFLDLSLKERVLMLHQLIASDPDFFGLDTYVLKHSSPELLEARPNFVKWSLVIGSELCNKGGNLHGGASATLLDYLTSTVLVTIATEGFLDGGHVSRTITMSYLRPVPMNAKVTVECEVHAAGRNTANVIGRIYNDQGKLCVTCVHDKVVFPGLSGKGRESKL